MTRSGQGWYVYTLKRFIPPKQGLEPHFQNLVDDFRGGECFKFFTAIIKEKDRGEIACVHTNTLKKIVFYVIIIIKEKSIQHLRLIWN